MGIDAVAVLRIPPARLSENLKPAPDEVRQALQGSAASPVEGAPAVLILTGKNGIPFVARGLEDGICIATGAPFATAGEELSFAVRAFLGPLLDEHHEPRGIFFFPSVTEPHSGETYDLLVERVGDAGEWAPAVSEDHVPEALRAAAASGMPGDLGALLGNVMASLDPSLVQNVARAIGGHGDAPVNLPAFPDVSPADFQSALQKAQELMAKSPELQELQKKIQEDMLRKSGK
ncbi:MAG TPA: hypothetical protein VNO21_12770 [Polyangiaceae bacterium]|nr:hypothetical protein [Polyangiaceae bacterium]